MSSVFSAMKITLPTTWAASWSPGDIHDLKLLMKTLFEQLDTMLNLLTTLLSKLP
jgi:hypothetical protein